MFDIFDDNLIHLTRGNSATISILPISTDTTEPVILDDGDSVLFTMKDSKGNTVLQKTLTNDDYSDPEDETIDLLIEPEDTIDLLTGEYKYDCLLLLSNGEAITFISSTVVIDEAVGTYRDVNGGGDP